MNDTVKIIFGLLGGLALFLYGMNSMSAALQKAAGARMKKILGILTINPVTGALAGALVTAVLQSSSATTVMVIGFVSAGLMSLPQAISVIFGANIGTTMTAQLMAFKISNYIYPIIFIGFIINFVSKKEKIRNIGTVIFSFGVLFEGIEIMGGVMKPLASSPFFLDLMGKVTNMPVLGVLLGACMTLVVQSSSATIAVLQNFASQPGPDGVSSAIGLAGAIPILLGDNIGTTITALLASIGQSKNAKRTAIAHSIFNITGSVVFLFLIPIFANFVRMISPAGPETEVISRQIANAHTTFNIVCTLVWLPLIHVMVKIVTTVIPGEDERAAEAGRGPKYLDERLMAQPITAMYLVSQEIRHLSECGKSMIRGLKNVISGAGTDALSEYSNAYQDVKALQDAISDYVTKLFSSGKLNQEQSERTASLLYVANSIDRIADRCDEITQTEQGVRERDIEFTSAAKGEINQTIDIIGNMFDNAMKAIENGSKPDAEAVLKGEQEIQDAEKDNTLAHLNRVRDKICNPSLTTPYSRILYNLDRAGDNCVAIAEEALSKRTLVGLSETGFKSVDEVK